MIYLPYDGSLNGDWISWYAIRMASRSPQKKLVLVHVLDGKLPAEQMEAKITALEARCRGQQVELISNTFPPSNQSLFESLMRFIPEGEETICVCGTRVRSKRRGFLAGTISAKFLKEHKFNVLAIRVVQPGIFGNAKQFLLPLAGHPRKLKSLSPFLRLFPPDIQDVYLLRIMAVSAFRFRHLSSEQRRSLLKRGRSYLSEATAEIAQEFASPSFYLDTRVIVSDDWPGEILMHANHLKVQMILLGASERTLPARFLYYENALERILTRTPCDMGIYRSL
jgi:nucleotide-binding universal stress UspA family protein